MNKILAAGDVFLLASEQLAEERKKLELLLPNALNSINELNKISNCLQQPLEEAASEAIKIYRNILSEGTLVITKEVNVLIEESKRLKKASAGIQDAAERIRVFSVASVGLSALGIGLIAGVIGLIYGIREGYPVGYKSGFTDGTSTREYQIENDFLERIGLEKFEFTRDSSIVKLKHGYKLIGKQLDDGYFIKIHK